MMKKIKNIQQLKSVKKKLAHRQAELEKLIRYDWLDVKQSLQPGNMGQSILNSALKSMNEKKGGGLFADSISQIAAGITRDAIVKAGEKIRRWFKKS